MYSVPSFSFIFRFDLQINLFKLARAEAKKQKAAAANAAKKARRQQRAEEGA